MKQPKTKKQAELRIRSLKKQLKHVEALKKRLGKPAKKKATKKKKKRR